MTTDEIISLGTKLGITYRAKTNYQDSLKKGIVVFDGVNGQRFLFNTEMTDDEIYTEMGQTLITIGKRIKCMEIQQVISVNND